MCDATALPNWSMLWAQLSEQPDRQCTILFTWFTLQPTDSAAQTTNWPNRSAVMIHTGLLLALKTILSANFTESDVWKKRINKKKSHFLQINIQFHHLIPWNMALNIIIKQDSHNMLSKHFMYIVNNRWKSSGTWEVSQTALWHCLINSAVIKLPQMSLKRHSVCIPLLQDWQSWDSGISRRTWLDNFRVCAANSTLSQKKKTLGLEWNSSKGTICYSGQVPRRDK